MKFLSYSLLGCAALATAMGADTVKPPVDPKAKGSDPVQVFILMGQSNMLGEGKIAGSTNGTLEFAVQTEHKYQYLVDESGKWTVSPNVRNVFIMGSGNASFENSKLQHNEFMTVTGSTIGPGTTFCFAFFASVAWINFFPCYCDILHFLLASSRTWYRIYFAELH